MAGLIDVEAGGTAPPESPEGGHHAGPHEEFRPSPAGWAARLAVPTVVVAFIFTLPVLVAHDFQANLVSLAAIFGIVGLSMNVLVGYLGQLSLGHQAFFGVGAYASALVATEAGLSFPAGIAAAMATGALSALFLGYVALRVRGLYLAIVTLAYGLLAEVSVFQIGILAQGVGADRPTMFAADRAYAYVCLTALVVVFAFDWRLTKSKAGRAFQAIRDDERVAASFGINIRDYKLLAFVISGTIAGLGGALFAHQLGVASADQQYNLQLALVFVLMTVVGGLGNRVGVLIGSTIFAVLHEILEVVVAFLHLFPVLDRIPHPDPVLVPVIGAALLVVTLISFPGGIAQQLAPIQNWVRGGRFDLHAIHDYAGPGGGIVGRP